MLRSILAASATLSLFAFPVLGSDLAGWVDAEVNAALADARARNAHDEAGERACIRVGLVPVDGSVAADVDRQVNEMLSHAYIGQNAKR